MHRHIPYHILSAVALVLMALSGCVEHPVSRLTPSEPPKTFLWLVPEGGLAEGISKQDLRWWAEDPDGLVIGYLFSVTHGLRSVPAIDTLTYVFTARTDTTLRFPLLVSKDTFLVVVRGVGNSAARLPEGTRVKLGPVAYADMNANGVQDADEGLGNWVLSVDPAGAHLNFPLRNSPPTVKFSTEPLNPASTIQPPETTFTVATFSWTGSDPDGDETIAGFRIALNSTAPDRWFTLPSSISMVTLIAPRSRTDGVSGEVVADVYGGTLPNMRLFGQVEGLRLDQLNTIYLEALDVAGDRSAPAALPSGSSTWFVKRPRSKVLVIGDYIRGDSTTVQTSYGTWIAAATDQRVPTIDFLNIRTGGQPPRLVPRILNPAFVQTLRLFDAVVWYTDQFPSLTVAQFPLYLYSQAGGKVLFTTEFSSAAADARSSLVDFTPLDSLFTGPLPAPSFPSPGDSRLPSGYILSPVGDAVTLSYPRLALNASPTTHLVFMRPVYRRADASVLYRLQPDTGNGTIAPRNRYQGQPDIAVIDADRRFVFMGLPLHLLNGTANGGQGAVAFLRKVMADEFGL